ncbi:MAG TPA: PKD domain-containing protein, partial [Verrucomicrobiae bacterium]|nr:PKD domain-containing protein [Verrucomicrobiae bacterium]
MKTVTARIFLGCTAFFVACSIPAVASAGTRTIRVVAYNIDADQDQNGAIYALPQPGLIAPSSGGSVTNGGVLEGIGEENVAGDPAQPIDILALEETTDNPTTVQPIVDGLNAFYSSRGIPAYYAMSPYQAGQAGGNNTGNGPNALVYNTNTLELVASVPVGTTGGSGNGEYRQAMRYEFAPAGATPAANNVFYVYVDHYKADSGSANAALRNGEAQIVRADSATLPSNARILYVGDYNCTTSSEPMYQTLVAAGANQAFDPLNPSGTNNVTWGSSTLPALTESATSLSARFDYHMMTSNVLYGVAGGLAYVPGTYHAFGNNGTTRYRSSVNNGSDTALNSDLTTNVTGITATQLYKYLTTATDHLPIVADYTIPVPTVFVIVMENENWASISGNAAAPYINNTLLPMASHAEQYYSPPGNHPSLPNYLWLEAGTNFGIAVDEDPSAGHQSTTNHLVTLLKNAGISWTSYQEDISGATCPLTAVNQYVPEHNPMVYFDDVTNTNDTGSTYCVANVRPYTELATDLHSNIVTRYNFITPNLCDDMAGNGGCPGGNLITQGDTWLSNNIPIIMNSQAYSNNGVIFITWDEGVGGDGPIGMIVLSPSAKGGGYSNTVDYTHSSLLQTIQEIFNVGPLLGDAANATDLSDLFIFGAQLAVSPASGFSSSGQIGGSFSPSSQTYVLSNTGGVAMVWSATNAVNWLTLSATNGTLAVGGSTNITVSINANANSLSVGSYSDSVVFATSNGSGTTTEPVSLTVNVASAQLVVTPSSVYLAGGPEGGPFNPLSQTYSVTNAGAAAMNWTANNSANWLTLSATSGMLAARASTNVIATINANANNLGSGGYSDTIGFTNTTNGAGNTTRAVSFNVGFFGFYDDFSTFSSGNLVGQQGWTQLGVNSNSPVRVTGGQAGFTGGLIVNSQTAYKSFKLTNETVFYGLTLTLTNAPNNIGVPYFAALYTGTNGTGTAGFRLAAESPDSAKTNYVLGVRITPATSDPYTFGTAGLNYGSQYRVIVEAMAGGSNVILYVNPTSGNLGAQTQYATNSVTSGLSSVGSVAISQLDSGTIASDGGLIGKVAVGDNFTTVYTELLGAPVASFTGSPTNGVVPLTVTFTDTSSGGATNWSWDFGDGGTTNVTTNVVQYTYNAAGVYSVSETVGAPGGSSAITNVNYITAFTPLVADFAPNLNSGAAPLGVSFTDYSTGSVTGWAWAFGDGNTSTNQNPSNLYVNPGVYTVQLIVSGFGGSSTDIVTSLISVYDPFAWWQLSYFGNTNNPNGAPGGDSTGTGMSNTNKFLAGFNPANPSAYLHIIGITEQTASVVVTYLGANGDNTYVPGVASRTNVLDYMTGDARGNYTNGG